MFRIPSLVRRPLAVALVLGLASLLAAAGVARAACPCSLWPDPVTPGFAYQNPNPIEVGLKFRTDVAGTVTGVRFFKSAGTTGTHVGRLWTPGGVKLAEAAFTNETDTGWQTATFTAPVSVVPNTTYIIACTFTDGNHQFSDTFDFFASAGVDNGPLHALAAGVDGPNGVYGENGAFFDQTHRSSNYWVDLVFVDNGGTDTTPPVVTSVVPAAGATGVTIGSDVTASFSEPIDASTISGTTFQLLDALNQPVAATVSYAADAMTATLHPLASLATNSVYLATVKGGDAGVKDVAGNALASDDTWSFTTEAPDLTPPTVASVMPVAGSTRLRPATRATVRFSEPMDPTTVTTGTIELHDALGALVPSAVAYDAASSSATLTPAAALARATTYSVRVRGGSGGVRDASGNAMVADYAWSFGTAPIRPAVDAAPGGPILIVAGASNLYSRYLVEVLRTEGLNEFDLIDVSALTSGVLASHDVVVLGDLPLTAAQVALLADWVNAGGRLVAMRPDKQLAGLLGLSDAGVTLDNRYLLIDTAHGPGVGIVGQTLQFHGTADAYTLNGATSLATLYSDLTTATPYPAVTTHAVGANGGVACAFTFDLARSIVWTHQGNPAWQIGHVNDQQNYGTALDLFWPDWIDFNRIGIPQADEQQRFLANLILSTNEAKRPLPRFWYLPRGKKAAIVLTGDDHWGISTPSGKTQDFFDRHIAQSTPGCSPDDWECIRSSSYGFDGCLMTDAQAAAYTAQGFEFGLHADAGLAAGNGAWCGAWPDDMPGAYNAQLEPLMLKYASIPVPSSERSHCYSWFGYTGAPGWQGYAGTPEVEGNLDIHFDTNISYNPASWATVNPGYQMGSGMMMRFVQADNAGTMTKFLDVYNAGTQMCDDNGQGAAAMRTIVDSFLDRANGPEGYYGGFVVNMHSDDWYGWSYDGSDQIVASAKAHDIPVVSGRQMCDWLDGRNGSSFGSIAWNGTTLSFSVAVGTSARNLMGMIPSQEGPVPLTGLTRDGQPVAFTVETIKGRSYAFFPATAGAYAAVYTPDVTPPVVSAVSAQAASGSTATIRWTTDEPATSRVDLGTSPSALATGATDAALVTAHAVPLTGLQPNTTYYYRVVSADGSGNVATSPAASGAPASFSTPSAALSDLTVADFSAGTPDANLAISQIADGEVILAPTVDAEFSGSSLPPGWTSSGGGTATVSGGVLTLNGATVGPPTYYTPGHTVEAIATFTAAPYEHVGFGVDYTSSSGDAWAMISTGQAGSGLLARSWTGSGAYDTQSTPIPGSWFGTPHRYRVDWGAASIDFYVDGALVASHAVAITTPMRPLLSVGSTGVSSLTVDWVHMSPYAGSGTFTSRVLDARGPAHWQALSWTCDLPPGAALAMSARTGNVATPDGSWTGFTPVGSSGGALGVTSRYIQYRAALSSSDASTTPVLRDVSASYTQDQPPPPEITAVSADASAGTSATIGWTTDEPASSRVDWGTSAGALTQSASSATLATQHSLTLTGLQPATTYWYRVSSTDAAGASATSPTTDLPPASFATPTPSLADVTVADFSAGTPDASVVVSQMADGELILAPAAGSDFTGSSLPAGWSVVAGAPTVANGLLSLNGATAGVSAATTPGHSVEAMATLVAAPYEHVGFGVNFTAAGGDAWAILSTGASGNGVYARCWTGVGGFDTQSTPIPGSWLGAPHRYRVDWKTSSIDYYIDGTLVATHDVAITAPMRPLFADGSSDAGTLTVDWARMTPYASPGAFTSRVFDAGAPASWPSITWTADLPAGTALAMSARTGNTATPDATWSAFAPLASSGSGLAATGRYLQYQATLSTTDPASTPVVRDVHLAYAPIPQSRVAAVVGPGTWVSTATPSVTIPVTFTRTESGSARASSVTFHLSAELQLLDPAHPANSVHQGSWLQGFNSTVQVVDLHGGDYRVDQTILGDPCGVTTGGTLFTLDVTNAGADGTGTITVTQVSTRDCLNQPIDSGPGAAASLIVDRTPPTAVADLAATPGASGSAPGTRRIALSFTVPGDAATVELWRAPFGGYPFYDRAPGAGHAPTAPASYPPPAPWTRAGTLAGPGSDDPGSRDFWSYVVATRDAHGNTAFSSPSPGVLDYVLGDTHNGNPDGDCVGDDQVTLSDISFLGAHYGHAVTADSAFACLDVGPTTDYRVTSRPTPDGVLDFDDLALFAIDYGAVLAAPATRARPAAAAAAAGAAATRGASALALEAPPLPEPGGTFAVALHLQGAGEVHALGVDLGYDAVVVQPLGVEDGELAQAQALPHVTLSARPASVDVALLGAGDGFGGDGVLARIRFRVLAAGDPRLAARAVRARDALNHPLTLAAELTAPVIPTTTGLSRAMPTPFAERTAFELALARPGDATVAIYSVDGRRIRTLASGTRAAGTYRLAWDGRDDDGRVVAAGVYFARLTTTGVNITRTLVRVR